MTAAHPHLNAPSRPYTALMPCGLRLGEGIARDPERGLLVWGEVVYVHVLRCHTCRGDVDLDVPAAYIDEEEMFDG